MVWLLAAGALVGWVAIRLGVFSPYQLVATEDGARWLPNALAGVDHPFHIARAETLRRALFDGGLLRWIAHHQGGYPVEFYPLGVAWLEVALWAITFGAFSIAHIHTVVVAIIFVMPGIAFAVMAGQDGWSPRVAVIALTLHVVVPGDWWHGGYTELVQWGLVTNVAGAVAALFVLAYLTRYVETGDLRSAALAALAAAGAVYTNPRSLIALVAIGLAVGIAAVVQPRACGPSLTTMSARTGLVAVLSGCLAAPELLSLIRFSGLYEFVRYERYQDLGEYLRSAASAVSPPVLILALAGTALALVHLSHPAARAAAITLLIYVLTTVVLIGDLGVELSQLEPTRLMPFQRLLTVYLAATAVEAGIGRISRLLGARAVPARNLAIVALVLGLVLARSGGSDVMPIPAQTDPLAPALFAVQRAAGPEQADFEEAIRLADAETAPGTALLVIGSSLSWHQRLWAPLWTDRPMMYDNWLWYWHDAHAGTPGYVAQQGHHYPDPASTLDLSYLSEHGIGAVVVTGPVAEQAAVNSGLDQRSIGTYNVFLVREPTTVVTFGDVNAGSLAMSANDVIAAGISDGDTATIRQNWYPRWQAIVNGEPAAVSRSDDGYMSVLVSPGPVTLELRYGADAVDWLGRSLAVAGLVATGMVATWRRRQAISLQPRRADERPLDPARR
jgi:hypothetical protein